MQDKENVKESSGTEERRTNSPSSGGSSYGSYGGRRYDHFERTRAQVYATGNKWAIENFNATHY